MAVRSFDGIDDDLVRATGALSSMTYGAFGAIVNFANFSAFRTIVLLEDSSGNPRVLWWTANATPSDISFDNGTTGQSRVANLDNLTAGDWWFVLIRKPTGSVTPRVSMYNMETSTWTHANMSGSFGNWTSAGSTGHLAFAYSPASSRMAGLVAVVGAWVNEVPWASNSTGDSAIEAAGLHTSAQAWLTAGADLLNRFDQSSTSTSVLDDTGNGGNQTSITGTTVVTGDDPPGFNFSLGTSGTAAATSGFTAAASGTSSTAGTAAATSGFVAVASGTSSTAGAATGSSGFTAAASGTSSTAGAAATTLGFTASATGMSSTAGTAQGSSGFVAAASATGSTEGAATATSGFVAAAAGTSSTAGTAAATSGFVAAASAATGPGPAVQVDLVAGPTRRRGQAEVGPGLPGTFIGPARSLAQAGEAGETRVGASVGPTR